MKKAKLEAIAADARKHGVMAVFVGSDKAAMREAAATLSRDLDKKVRRVDVGQVVSQYIGETEKNLDRLFADASASGDVLYFDEADALFGKRSEVRDSHDRYANQAIELVARRADAFQGVVILAVSDPDVVAEQETRRFSHVVDFR